MSEPLALAAGWGAQAVTWLASLWQVGRGAAAQDEWPREVVLRSFVVALAAGSLLLPRGERFPLGPTATVALLGLALAGHGLAVYGRLHLGPSWGIGTTPRRREVVHSGPYRLVAHPIYWGTGTAILAQALLLQNWPSLLLLVGATIVNPSKVVLENRHIRRAER
jgi:protein-S-isoprenylcysteine O-methyltransferase Ste14